MPSVETLHRDYGDDGFTVLLVNVKEDEALVASFIDQHDYTPTVLLDGDGTVARSYLVYGVPVWFVVDRTGRVAYKSSGFLGWDSPRMRTFISKMIAER